MMNFEHFSLRRDISLHRNLLRIFSTFRWFHNLPPTLRPIRTQRNKYLYSTTWDVCFTFYQSVKTCNLTCNHDLDIYILDGRPNSINVGLVLLWRWRHKAHHGHWNLLQYQHWEFATRECFGPLSSSRVETGQGVGICRWGSE